MKINIESIPNSFKKIFRSNSLDKNDPNFPDIDYSLKWNSIMWNTWLIKTSEVDKIMYRNLDKKQIKNDNKN